MDEKKDRDEYESDDSDDKIDDKFDDNRSGNESDSESDSESDNGSDSESNNGDHIENNNDHNHNNENNNDNKSEHGSDSGSDSESDSDSGSDSDIENDSDSESEESEDDSDRDSDDVSDDEDFSENKRIIINDVIDLLNTRYSHIKDKYTFDSLNFYTDDDDILEIANVIPNPKSSWIMRISKYTRDYYRKLKNGIDIDREIYKRKQRYATDKTYDISYHYKNIHTYTTPFTRYALRYITEEEVEVYLQLFVVWANEEDARYREYDYDSDDEFD